VLFADLVGFTARAEGVDPEDVRELLSRYFAGASTVVARYGGTVEKFIGDAVMAVWGVPVAHEDDAERAVRAALELVAMTEVLGEENATPGLTMRVGLVTGEVAVTLGATGEGMVAGDAVNTAARVQAAAEPGQVWVDEATKTLTAAAIAYEPAGEHRLKGKVEAARLFAARSVVGSIRGIERVDGLEAPLTGRDREMRLVKELFHGAQETHHGSLVVVEGEPGVGKSRIAWEFEKYIDGLTATTKWHRGRCLAYGEGVAFWALAEAVRGRLGLTDTDAGATVAAKLQDGLDRYVPEPTEQDWLRPRLAVLIGSPDADGSFTAEELYAAWTAFLGHVSAGDLVALVLDDAHYADDGLLGFLEYLLSTADFPVFVVALARTGLLARRPDLAANRRTTVLHLDPLTDDTMATLLDGLVAELPADVRSVLVERSEGIPLFAVETVRGLIDRDLVIPRDGRYVLAEPERLDLGSLAAPASLQALVAARLDALAAAERRIVGDASVLGMTFAVDALAALTPDVEDREDLLKSLVRKQILDLETDRFSASRGQYRFVQAVVRQVAYETLSKRDRKARHLAVAAHMEAQPDSADDLAAVLAQHYLDALASSSSADEDRQELLDRSIGLLDRAAGRARKLGAPREALRYLQSALDFTDDVARRAPLLATAADAADEAGEWQQAVELGSAAVQAFESLGDHIAAGAAAATAGMAILATDQDPARAMELVSAHWERLADNAQAARAKLKLARVLAGAHANRGEAEAADVYVQEALRVAESLGDEEAICNVIGRLGRHFVATGAPFTGAVLYEAQVDLARDLKQPALLADALIGAGIERMQRDVKGAVEYYEEAVAAARQSGEAIAIQNSEVNLALGLWIGGNWQDLAAILTGGHEDGYQSGLRMVLAVIERWLSEARGIDPLPMLPVLNADETDNLSDLAWLEIGQLQNHLRAGAFAEAASIGESAIAHAIGWSGFGDDFIHLWPPAVVATIEAGQLDRAAELIRQVEEAPRGLQAPALTAHTAHLKGRLAMARDDRSEVEAWLVAAIDGFDAYGSDPLAARAQADLGRWLGDQGRAADADPLLTAARVSFERLQADGWLREYELLSARIGS
jgi:class 3 adenylate cyclase/tetratricopeptide (TPR) repeat protein